MMTKIEEVARAMHERADSRSDPRFRVTWEKCRPDYRDMMLDDALAALRALREPSEGMITLGKYAMREDDLEPTRKEVLACYEAMIDAAIHEAETA